jgi:hypothetical protein
MALATTAQVQRINQLIADSKLTTEQVQKILANLRVDSIENLSEYEASRVIDSLDGPMWISVDVLIDIIFKEPVGR